jgi:hypothetical protein
MLRVLRSLVPFAVAVAVMSTGCKPKVGAACSGSQEACIDPSTGLFCLGGKMTAMSCNGAKGCQQQGAQVACDNPTAGENDGCDTPNDVACRTDLKAALQCNANKFSVVETCKGVGGCAIKSDKVTCDNDVSDLGDPCHFNGDYACTSDKLLVMKCVNNTFTALNSCRGPKSCRVFDEPEAHKLTFLCDDSVANVGDACDENTEEACTLDKKSLLVCTNYKFTMSKACPGASGCNYTVQGKTETYTCDTGSSAAPPTPGPVQRAKKKFRR